MSPQRLPVVSRRAALAALSGAAVPFAAAAASSRRLEAIAFDAFPIFDPRSITNVARATFPAKGDEFARMWMSKLFAYTWLETSAGRYVEFATLAEAAISSVAATLGLDVTPTDHAALLASFTQLDAWPDVKPALERLRAHGVRLVVLSNLGEAALAGNMARAGLTSYFEPPLSTDRVRQFKPAPAAYRMAIDALALPREAIGFAAFGGWDALGATWFGYRTVWVNRLGVSKEPLEPGPEIVSSGMDGVLQLAGI